MRQKIKLPLIVFTNYVVLLLYCSLRGFGVQAVSNNTIHVITPDKVDPLVLDCDFDAEKYNSTLVVKWLKDEKPIYQWIKGRKPTVYPLSKGIIDEESQIPPYTDNKHLSIIFPVPTRNMTGTYKCLIETISSTHIVQTNVQIIDTSHADIQLHYMPLSNSTLVTCAVDSVYPEPKLDLWTNDDVSLSKISEKLSLQPDGLYNATSVASINDLNEDDEIGCTLYFSGLDFNVTKVLRSSGTHNTITNIYFIIAVATAILRYY